MSTTTKTITAALMLLSFTTGSWAQDGPGTFLGRFSNPNRPGLVAGLRRVLHPETRPAAMAPASLASTQSPSPQVGSDPYGFGSILNRIRATAGLPPVAYDAELSAWATRNNIAQNWRGIGHHVNPNCFQNCAWNMTDANGAAQTWMSSARPPREHARPVDHPLRYRLRPGAVLDAQYQVEWREAVRVCPRSACLVISVSAPKGRQRIAQGVSPGTAKRAQEPSPQSRRGERKTRASRALVPRADALGYSLSPLRG